MLGSPARRIRASRTRRVTLALMVFASGLGAVAFACGYDGDGTQPAGIVPTDAPATFEASVIPMPDAPFLTDSSVPDAPSPGRGCPAGLPGAAMIEVPDAGFCIDATEVTNADYDLFLARTGNGALDAGIPEGGLPSTCAGLITSFGRASNPDGGAATYPAQRLGWCAAAGFCAYAGKRLCKGPTGGTSARRSGEWYLACSANGARGFPYDPNGSDAHVDMACNDSTSATVPVGSSMKCVGGVPGLFDMSGNVQEWVSTCDDDAGSCDTAGGSFSSGVTSSDCSEIEALPREYAADVTGIRCCADLR